MKNIKIMDLSIENFKGIAVKVFNFSEKNMSVLGDNATGKTTIYDALTWLLFDKDSHGQKQFDIKPLDENGDVLNPGAITTVTAKLSVDGEVIELKKQYREKWSAKRGSLDKTFDGNTSDYFVDGVPCKKNEYERKIAEIIDENVFKLLTSVYYFSLDLKWQERRKILFDICNMPSDNDIMAGNETFAELFNVIGKLTVDDYKKKLQAERKGFSGTRDAIPVRLDECMKTVNNLREIDFEAIKQSRNSIQSERDKLQTELMKLDANTLLGEKRNALGSLKNDLQALETENSAYRRAQEVPVVDNSAQLKSQKMMLTNDLKMCMDSIERLTGNIDILNKKLADFRAIWGKIDGEEFTGSTVCPTCKRPLEKDKIEQAVQQFAEDKNVRLNNVVEQSNRVKAEIAEAQEHINEKQGQIKDIETRIAKINGLFAVTLSPSQPVITDMPDFAVKKAEITAQITAVNAEINSLEGETTAIKNEIQGKITALDSEVKALDSQLANEAIIGNTEARMDALREEAKRSAEHINRLDKMIFMCEEFTKYKVRFVEDGVNSRFKMARFKLFDEQINGGMTDCCTVTYKGISYDSNLNKGARINVGLDICSVLSDYYSVKVPLFIDDAESVTKINAFDTQIIRLCVSENDKELRCEAWD